MEIIIFEGFWNVDDVQEMNEYLFLFGDNDIERGKGGQAIIRDEPNTCGIPTKKYPSYRPDSFYSDEELDENICKIDKAFENVLEKAKNYKGIVLPKDGFGTGLAELPTRAPKTLEYINKKIGELKKHYEQ